MSSFDDHTYLRFTKSVEKWLIRMLCFFMVLLILIQGVLRIPWVRIWITSVDRMEGIPYDTAEYVPAPLNRTDGKSSEVNPE